MAKLKTHKSIARRIKATKTGKYMRRRGGQSHFNSRENGKTGRNKKRNFAMAKTEHRALQALMPYGN